MPRITFTVAIASITQSDFHSASSDTASVHSKTRRPEKSFELIDPGEPHPLRDDAK